MKRNVRIILCSMMFIVIALLLMQHGETTTVCETFNGVTCVAPHYSWHYFVALPILYLAMPWLIVNLLAVCYSVFEDCSSFWK